MSIVARSFPGQSREEEIAGVKLVRWGGFDQSRFLALNLLRNFSYSFRLLSHLSPAQILVTNDFWTPLLAARFAHHAGAVVVNANRFPKGQYRLYRRAARIAAASTVVAEAVERECPALAARTKVLPNPIDTEVFRPSDGAFAASERRLLFVGRLHPEKGVEVLIQAFAHFSRSHPGWRLGLVGPAAENQGGGGVAFESRLRELAKDLPIDFAGPVFDHVELAGLLRQSALFCYPSFADRGEALPLAPLEAMACGIPVLTSDLRCFSDYLVNGSTGFVFDHRAVDQVASLAASLESLVAQPELLTAVGRNAALRAADFGYAEVAAKYLSEFESILDEAC